MNDRSNVSRRNFISTMLVASGAISLASSSVGQSVVNASNKKPNVLFVAVDDLRPQMGCYGETQMVTPNMDRLANQGVLFNHHHVQIAVCVPSRVAMLTGVRPDSTRQLYGPHVFRKNCTGITTMPEQFESNGYHTASFGKIWHHRETAGFTEAPWYPSWDYLYTAPPFQGRVYWKPDQDKAEFPAFECADNPDDMYQDGQTTVKAIDALQRFAQMDQPFWLGVGFWKPHLPFVAPKKYWDLYNRADIELAQHLEAPEGMPSYAFNYWGDMSGFDNIPKNQYEMTDDQARELIHGYYACVSFSDALLGRLLDQLETLGLKDNTIVVLWGDHGWHLGELGMWSKHTNFERATRAPLIVSVPGNKSAGSKSDALTETVDIFPSLCELCELPLPQVCEGTSFVPVLTSPGIEWKPAVFSQFNRGNHANTLTMGYSIRTNRYRYVEWVKGWEGTQVLARELYDYNHDIDETVNLIDKPEHSQLVQQLADQLHAGWQAAKPQTRTAQMIEIVVPRFTKA